jgi:anti-repressor protein
MSDQISLALYDRQIGDTKGPTVNAREIHTFVGSKQEYPHWVKNRLSDFTENLDFEVVASFINNPQGGRRFIDYFVTVDVAKHICMLERNEKGKQLRQYFIRMEKQALASIALPDFTNPAIAARAFADQYEKRLLAENASRLLAAQVEAQAPAVAFTEAVSDAEGAIDIGAFSKVIKWGRNNLFAWMREQKILQVEDKNVPYQAHVESGYFRVVEHVKRIGRTNVIIPQTLITGKGQIWLCRKLGITPPGENIA